MQTLTSTLAADKIRVVQIKYKKYYDKHAKPILYSIGEWTLIRYPQGKKRKLSRPWHGPYHITALTQMLLQLQGTIQVHMNRLFLRISTWLIWSWLS